MTLKSLLAKMTPENFVFWLSGFLELNDKKVITALEIEIIKDHINLVLENK